MPRVGRVTMVSTDSGVVNLVCVFNKYTQEKLSDGGRDVIYLVHSSKVC